jgi:uncharacterized protein YyaL (SSP411 family)
MRSEGGKANRLLGEKSPYLRQHAYNPVDWYPWGDEALDLSVQLDRPIFLSIGYSSCHWCHVMERESFEDQEVASYINDNFIPIKVDREERPDLDATYMAAAQLLHGGGGWPLTLVLTPQRRPFFAATYLPKRAKGGMLGLLELLPTIMRYWKERRGEIEETSEKVLWALKEQQRYRSGGDLGEEVLISAFESLLDNYDEVHGGFGRAPKFPTPHRLTFLLRYWYRSGDERARDMAVDTLEAMRQGGIFDQLAFGFHRYSTDERWMLPHFEKMLYDQALLALAYVEAWQATGRDVLAQTARQTLDYVLGTLTTAQGGFCSAEDADSEGEEGKYYLWTMSEVRDAVGAENTGIAQELFGLEVLGNVGAGIRGELEGKNVLHLTNLDAMSGPRFEEIRNKLLKARQDRARPLMDDKVMSDWNGLMIAALARTGWALRERRYVEAARRAADMVLTSMRTEEGLLLHVGSTYGVAGFLDDHAFMAWGLLELFQADQDPRWLRASMELMDAMLDRFWDDEGGGFFQTDASSNDVLHRQKEVYDGALPSGNSVALQVLLTLYWITEDESLMSRAEQLIAAFSGSIFRYPENFAHFLCALNMKLGPFFSVVISGHNENADTISFIDALSSEYLPNKIVMVVDPGERGDRIRDLSPVVREYGMLEGRAAAHACTRTGCLQATDDPQTLVELLHAVR